MMFEALIFEIVATFILTFMVFSLAVDKRAPKHIYGIGIGGALGVSVLAFGSVSGAALNPCRWLGPAILNGEWKTIWIYTTGPIVGGAIAALLYKYLFLNDNDEVPQAKEVEFD